MQIQRYQQHELWHDGDHTGKTYRGQVGRSYGTCRQDQLAAMLGGSGHFSAPRTRGQQMTTTGRQPAVRYPHEYELPITPARGITGQLLAYISDQRTAGLCRETEVRPKAVGTLMDMQNWLFGAIFVRSSVSAALQSTDRVTRIVNTRAYKISRTRLEFLFLHLSLIPNLCPSKRSRGRAALAESAASR